MKGTVQFINEKNFNGKNLYSFKLANDDTLYMCGALKPRVSKGDYIEFDVSENARGQKLVDVPTISIKEAKVVAASGSKTTSIRENWDARAAYWEAKEKRDIETVEPRISYAGARNSAIAAAGVVLESGSFKLPAKEADKYEAVLGLIDELTDRFYEAIQKVGADTKQEPEVQEPEVAAEDEMPEEWE